MFALARASAPPSPPARFALRAHAARRDAAAPRARLRPSASSPRPHRLGTRRPLVRTTRGRPDPSPRPPRATPPPSSSSSSSSSDSDSPDSPDAPGSEPSSSRSFDDYAHPYPNNLELSYDASDGPAASPRSSWPRNVSGTKARFEYVFVRLTLVAAGAFALMGVVASLVLSGLLFAMGLKEVMYEAVRAFATNNPVNLVSSAVGALDRFLLGMVCLVFGLGSFELFLARSNREGEVRDRRLKKLSWLRVKSIDDLEQKVGEIIVAVMVVNLLEMSLHMKMTQPMDLVWAALAALFSAGALALLHWSSSATHQH